MVHLAALFGAACFIIANSFRAVTFTNLIRGPGHYGALRHELNPSYIQEEWDFFHRERPLVVIGNSFNLAAWILFMCTMFQLAWSLSRGGMRLVGIHASIAIFALGGVTTELISRLLLLGSYLSAHWVARSFELGNWLPSNLASSNQEDGMGWRHLEITGLIFRGMLRWIDAFEWICLFLICFLVYYSMGTQSDSRRVLSMNFARLGLVIGFLSFVDLAANLLRLEDRRIFNRLALIIGLVNTIFFLPLWLLYLAFNLHRINPKYSEQNDNFAVMQPI